MVRNTNRISPPLLGEGDREAVEGAPAGSTWPANALAAVAPALEAA